MDKQSRRNFLKGTRYSALALVGMSTIPAAAAALTESDNKATTKIISQSLRFVRPERDIKLYLQQPIGEERITLINNNQHPIRLDSTQPLQLKNINGSLVLQVKQSAHGDSVLPSGDVLILDVRTDNQTVSIRSAHPALSKHFSIAA